MVGNAVVVAVWLAVGIAALLAGLVWLRSVERAKAVARRQGRAQQHSLFLQERTEGDGVAPEPFPDTLAS